MTDRILILYFGSQVTQLIARRVRESGVYCEILPFNASEERIRNFGARGIILSGGPASTVAADSPRAPEVIFEIGVPLLGVCYGQQTLAKQLGGEVAGWDHQEFGRACLEVKEYCALFEGLWQPGERHQVWMSHGDKVVRLPEGFRVVAVSEGAPFAAVADDARHYYGVQFHPEVMHTPDGARLIANFAHRICGCAGDWTMAAFRQQAVAAIRQQVGPEGRVICGLSGGVDSSVAAVLIHEAIGERLTCIFVDHGLLRAGEAEQVVEVFRGHYNIPLVARDASELFLGRLAGVTDPEEKRKIIGRTFIEVFEEEAAKAGDADFLAQGTLYPDVIESVSLTRGRSVSSKTHDKVVAQRTRYPDVIERVSFTGGRSVTIKSHHNVGGLPERMNLKLVEPLRELFKDEVRELGRELGLPESLVGRHPFPGPGLAIRIPGEVTREDCEILRKADAIYLEEIRKAGLYDAIWQAFAVLLPVRTVGVMGDARSYDKVCALRAVTSVDGMTADSYPFDHAFLSAVATRIINEVRGINRVVYDVTSKPPGTIEWE